MSFARTPGSRWRLVPRWRWREARGPAVRGCARQESYNVLPRGEQSFGDDTDARHTGAIRRVNHFHNLAVTQRPIAADEERALLPRRENVAEASLERCEFHRLLIDRDTAIGRVFEQDVW